ncbi:MAG: PTS sugar transporter subunit IIA [Candidatus Eisenbacteria bacterium]
MLLSELLAAAAVDPRLKAAGKRDAVAELVGLLESAHGLDSRGEILDRVLRREAMMSTGIGNGVAIPHGKARAVDRMMAACAVSPAGVDFEAVDGEPAHLFILLVSPESVGTPHVKVLANISRLLKEESVRRSLREADSASAFLAALKAAEAKYLAAASS